MQLIHQLIFRFLAIGGFIGGFTSCATEPAAPRSDRVVQKLSFQKIFYYPYDSVWRAAQLAVKYPIAVNNMDNGVLETDWIRGIDGFSPPHLNQDSSPGIRYKIQLSLVKGKSEGRESVRVTIIRRLEKQRDFFSPPESLETDGLEEKILFYRMERELIIEEALKKAARSGA